MIVPDYWAEAKKRHQAGNKQTTVLRYGWSITSQEDALRMAEERATEALQRFVRGEKISKAEWKTAYNGADGIPIREEVLSRHGDEVITRNSYGAHCLNSPTVLFGDIDFTNGNSAAGVLGLVLLAGGSFSIGCLIGGKGMGVLLIFFALLIFPVAGRLLKKLTAKSRGEKEKTVRETLSAFLARHPDWNIRLYETPAGYRVLATHKPFDPNSTEVQEFFTFIKADPVYARMCQNQKCFRARLTAKPWRMGISTHMRPRPGIWPVHPDRLKIRNEWIGKYETKAQNYAACHLVDSLGSGIIHARVKPVVDLHDSQSRALNRGCSLA
jgi:hypothetical protein